VPQPLDVASALDDKRLEVGAEVLGAPEGTSPRGTGTGLADEQNVVVVEPVRLRCRIGTPRQRKPWNNSFT